MGPLIKAALVAGFWLVPVFSAAHDWQSDSEPLSSGAIENVLDTLNEAAEIASTEGWVAYEGRQEYPIQRFYDFAYDSNGRIRLNEDIDRVLVAYEAFQQGDVDEMGNFTDGADVLRWLDYLHTGDVGAIAPFLERLKQWQLSFPGSGQ